MFKFQPKVQPLPKGISLPSQTVLITGATSGMGAEMAKQFLSFNASHIILTGRNMEAGQTIKTQLQSAYPKATIDVLKLDMEDSASIKEFVTELKGKTSRLDVAMLNAGGWAFKKKLVKSGRDEMLQVNYLANVLLTIQLLPMLEATARQTGRPSRLTWTGSEMFIISDLFLDPASLRGKSVFDHIDSTDPSSQIRYATSKLLVMLFQRELAEHYNSDLVIINNVCPGMVSTNLARSAGPLLQTAAKLLFSIKSRTTEQGAWLIENGALVAGKETHGKFLKDKDIYKDLPFFATDAGRDLQKKVWNETIDEFQGQEQLPSWMEKI